MKYFDHDTILKVSCTWFFYVYEPSIIRYIFALFVRVEISIYLYSILMMILIVFFFEHSNTMLKNDMNKWCNDQRGFKNACHLTLWFMC